MALLVQPWQAPDTSFVSQIAQAAAQMRQRQQEAQQNYALQVEQEARRAQEAALQRDFDRQRHEELIRQFTIKTDFDKGKDQREAELDKLRVKDYAGRIAERDYDNSVGGAPGGVNVNPPLPGSPELGAVPDPNAAPPVDLPPLPGGPAAAPAAAGTPGITIPQMPNMPGLNAAMQIMGAAVPKPMAQRVDPVDRAPVPKIVAPAPTGLVPPPDFQPNPKTTDYAASIASLDQSLRKLGVRNKAREDAVTDAAKRLLMGEQKAELAGSAATIGDAAKAQGLQETETGNWLDPKTGALYNVEIVGGKPKITIAKPKDAGLTPIPGREGLYTGPGGKGIYKDAPNGGVVKVGTDARLDSVHETKEGKPALFMSDGSIIDENGKPIHPENVKKIVGALDKPKMDAAAGEKDRESLIKERQFYANEAKRATDEALKLRSADLSELPAMPYEEGGKFYKGKSKAVAIDKAMYDKMKADFEAYDKRIKEAEERAVKFQTQVGDIQSRIDKLGAPAAAAPTPGTLPPLPAAAPGVGVGTPPPATPPAPAAPGGKKKYVWKDGKLVAE